jgi:hypothetical protein
MAYNYFTTNIPLSYHQAGTPLRDINHPGSVEKESSFWLDTAKVPGPESLCCQAVTLEEERGESIRRLRSPDKQ